MWSQERLESLEAIMLSAVVHNGVDALYKEKSDKLFVPSLNKLAEIHEVSRKALERASQALQSRGILSERLRYKDGYILRKPASLLEEVRRYAAGYFKRQKHFIFPPYMKELSREAQLERISSLLSPDDESIAIMHSAYLLPSCPVEYQGTRVLSIPVPLTMAMSKETFSKINDELNLVEIKGPEGAKDPLSFPVRHSSSDIVIFELKKMKKSIPIDPESEVMPIKILPAILNAVLLRSHPIRGVEQWEALLQNIIRHNSLKIGFAKDKR